MNRLALIFLIVLSPSILSAQQAVVEKYRAQYPTPMGASNAVACLKQIAAEVKGGILIKTEGSNCEGYSCDIICFSNGDHYDVFRDAEGAATPQWSYVGKIDASRCKIMGYVEPPIPPTEDNWKKLFEYLDKILVLLQQIAYKG